LSRKTGISFKREDIRPDCADSAARPAILPALPEAGRGRMRPFIGAATGESSANAISGCGGVGLAVLLHEFPAGAQQNEPAAPAKPDAPATLLPPAGLSAALRSRHTRDPNGARARENVQADRAGLSP